MPMAPHVGFIIGHHNQVEGSCGDDAIATGTQVFLAGLIRLNGCDRYVEKSAHAITANVATTAKMTITMSQTDLSWGRNGLKPTSKR